MLRLSTCQQKTFIPCVSITFILNSSQTIYTSLITQTDINLGLKCNALVICNHAPTPGGRAGDSRGNERGFEQSFAMAVREKYRGLLYRQKGPCNVKIAGCGEKHPHRVRLLAGVCWTKRQSPRYYPGMAGVVTND